LEHPWITGISKPEVELEESVVKSLSDFSRASKFRRGCLSVMAWSLSLEDRMSLREQFLAFDKGNTGTITLEEWKASLDGKSTMGSEEEAEMLFKELAVDHETQIGYTDFLAGAVQSTGLRCEESRRNTFLRLDADRSGVIKTDNLRTILGDSYDSEETGKLLDEVDSEGHGVISYGAFLDYLATGDGGEGPVRRAPGGSRCRTGGQLEAKTSIEKEVVQEMMISETFSSDDETLTPPEVQDQMTSSSAATSSWVPVIV